MTTTWNEVRLAAENVCDDAESARRVSNLSILAALAFDAGLAGSTRRKVSWSAQALCATMEQIALSPLPKLGRSKTAWATLAGAAQQSATLVEATGGPDKWVSALQSADFGRKTKGAYATPSSFADALVSVTLNPFLGTGQSLRIVDPSAGTGSLLTAALRLLGEGASDRELKSIAYAMHGVELDPEAREICCLLLWINAARAKPDLRVISDNIVCDNAITRDWWSSASDIFDALVMNPPWESLRHSLSRCDPNASSRTKTIARLSIEQQVSFDLPPLFSAQGTGDKNLFKAFLELAPHLIKDGGRIGALIPAAFASDLGMAPLRARYFNHFQLEQWTSFENLRRHFPIDGRYKFGILVGARSVRGTDSIAVRSFSTEPHEVAAEHVVLTNQTIRKLGGHNRMLPEVCDWEEVRVLSRIFECGTPFFEMGSLGTVTYKREMDLSLGKRANQFRRLDDKPKLCRYGPDGFRSTKGVIYLPLVEGRMVGRYDIFQKSWVNGSARTAKWEMNADRPISECRPQFVCEPHSRDRYRVAICDVTSATNARTVHAALVPSNWTCGNTAPVLSFENDQAALAGLAILNSLVFDWAARRLVGGLHLNKFYLASLVWPVLDSNKVGRLAKLAARMIRLCPRAPINLLDSSEPVRFDGTWQKDQEKVRIEAEIEREVATGFNLDVSMLQRIFSKDRRDRRGFWRYFASNPASQEAVADMLSKYDFEGRRTAVA